MSPSSTIRLALALTILAVTAACTGNRSPVAPTAALVAAPAPAPAPVPAPGPVDLTGPSHTYSFASQLDIRFPVSGYTRQSEYVLYDNGSFVLRYPSEHGYTGTYTVSGTGLVFSFSGDGRWTAAGTLTDESELAVRYNIYMWGADFEDALYVRSN
jgi:hypothetical protein